MSKTVISVENISKQYRLGEVGTGTLSHDLKKWFYKARGKEDPYLKIGEANDRASKAESDYVWALKDINFEVKQGEVLGIIGRNGAGKSTLLKILSKTTTPTSGNIKVKGRIASLLEVGTGFHPEMTGRENIYLNGAILGMRKREIDRKLDEIIDFSGVERYIDTPVKRYSSGMYVRLAFAVAAHLEPDILIVDEVLAVGDAEFQKKCLGKMKDVSVNEGRTVLFVSHNIASIQKLCNMGLLLQNGTLFETGKINQVVECYISLARKQSFNYIRRLGNKKAEILEYILLGYNGKIMSEFFMGDNIFLKVKVLFNINIIINIGINIKNNFEDIITHVANFDDNFIIKGVEGEIKEILIKLENIYFSPNEYHFDISLDFKNEYFDSIEGTLPFNIIEGSRIKRGNFPKHVKLYTKSTWKIV
jgi:lipopolysaccharide transport system ATP-binding protein